VVTPRVEREAVGQQDGGPGDPTAGPGLRAVLPTHEVLTRTQRWAKRVLDLTIGIPAFVLACPVILIAGIAVAIDSPGSMFFRQERLGKYGKPFQVTKLRTMTVANDDSVHREYVAQLIKGEASANGGLYKLVDDHRITRLGRILRRYSLDELPQLWCVIRGHMSLVGPRPPLAREAALYDDSAWCRLWVKPGLTGPWQVGGRSMLRFDEMVKLDVEYARGWRLRTDLALLARTPQVVVAGRGAV
jgi:lipopolysaccharide/colanic/teichoic acid biosynthesis glycosyltransferase